jgi:hypothetical protein
VNDDQKVGPTTSQAFNWAQAPDLLSAEYLRFTLGSATKPRGKNQIYAWLNENPQLVVRLGEKTKFAPKVRLLRFLAGDPKIEALATRNPYAKLAKERE